MKIFCIGKNYAKHAAEMGSSVPKSPMVFMKPPTALLKDNRAFYHPSFSKNIHHELELVLKICKNGKHIAPQFAHKYYEQITTGIDFTARDLQNTCKEKGHPWEIAKGFDHSAPIGEFISLDSLSKPNSIQFHLLKNGVEIQNGNSQDLMFSFNAIISHISQYFTMQQGDLIFTGTPEGVGKVEIGDRLEAFIEGKKLLDFAIK